MCILRYINCYLRASDISRKRYFFTSAFLVLAEVRLQVEETETNVTVEESDSVRLGCSIPSQSSRDSRFSVSWYVDRSGNGDSVDQPGDRNRKRECVFSIGHDAIFGNGNCNLREGLALKSRLQFERMASDQYSLTIHQARPSDAGQYYCHVEEWLLNPRNAWYRLTANDSGFTIVNVLQQGKSRTRLTYVHDVVKATHCLALKLMMSSKPCVCLSTVSSIQSVVCSNKALFYFVFFYPFPIFAILLIALLFVRYKSRSNSKSQEGKNGAPLLWIKEPHLSYSPTCLDPPALSLHPGSVD